MGAKDLEELLPIIEIEPLASRVLRDQLKLMKQLPDSNVDDAGILWVPKGENRRGSRHTHTLQSCEQVKLRYLVPRSEHSTARLLDGLAELRSQSPNDQGLIQ